MRLTKELSVTYVIIALNVLVFVCMLVTQPLSFMVPSRQLLSDWGGNYGILTLGGEAWRLLTCMFVHVGILHLAINTYVLLQLGGDFEAQFGWRRMLYVYVFCGLCSSLASAIWDPFNISAGASGATFGVYGHYLGALAISTKTEEERASLKQQSILALGLIVGITVYGMLFPGMDNAAHISGFAIGLITGLLAKFLQSYRLASVAISLVVAGAWFFVDRQIFVARGCDQFYDGIAAKKAKQFDKGLMAFSEFLKRYPNDREAYAMRAYCKMRVGDLEGAIKDFDRTIEIDPERPGPYNDRAWILAGLKRYDQALTDSNKSLELDPKSYAAYDTRGYILARKGEYDKAMTDFSKAIDIKSSDPAAYFHRAQVFAKLGDVANAQSSKLRGAKYEADPWETGLE